MDFEDFPQGTRDDLLDAPAAVADGGHPTIAKPLIGLGSGVMELALRRRGYAFRVVCALPIGADIWVLHAFRRPKADLRLRDPECLSENELSLLSRLAATRGRILVASRRNRADFAETVITNA
ncbi:MAG TPA: type II toxin-antitoxin system RelE/ParE family toxin [Acetobacteraceae bacterium]|nr:type II toxin-antitoxin system RelE/ParE family toxin [Acetobacteraceae bacterium]